MPSAIQVAAPRLALLTMLWLPTCAQAQSTHPATTSTRAVHHRNQPPPAPPRHDTATGPVLSENTAWLKPLLCSAASLFVLAIIVGPLSPSPRAA